MFKRRQPSTPIEIGSHLNERYHLIEQLGTGGAGVIFKAEDVHLGRIVAIKILTTQGGLAADKLERFRSEARSVARLNHPNIITLYDYSETNGQPYLVIEYVPGQDLWALDNGYSPNLMPFEVSLPIIDEILTALEYSHQHRVIHRDLKPENVMITPQGQVKVMDFGLARIQGQSRLTQDGLVAGTASYLAPELAVGELGDHRVDLYALGVIMYELLTGRRPFSGDDPLTVISQHIHAPVVPPQHYNPNIPDDLQTVVLKLLAKNPDDRPATATEVREALLPILAQVRGEMIEAVAPAGARQRPPIEVTTTDQRAVLDRIARGKMVGREGELAELKRRWDLARLGEQDVEPLVLISGEAGIGKTRLLRELQVYAGLRDGYVLHGAAREQDAGTPYAVLSNALRNYVNQQSSDVLRRQVTGFIAGEVVKLAPTLTEKIGHISPNPPLEPEAERARLLEQISIFLLNMAYEQPTLLLLDDLHFSDPASLDILETLVRRSQGTSLLVAGAYRDVALSYANPVNHLVASLNAAKLLYSIALRRLSQELVAEMVEALLGDTVSNQFLDSICRATEGNPLFVEEVIKGLATDGQIILRDGRWAQRETGQLLVPGSIKSVLGRRLERVKKPTLELLQLAAVIGRSFSLDVLSAAIQYDDESIQGAIEEALRFELIEVSRILDQPAVSGGQLTIHYQFQHALIRETLYGDLRSLRRRRLHRKVTAAMEQLVADELLMVSPAVLAHHFVAAAQDERAVPYLRQAGEAAYEVYAHAEAVDYLEQAFEILEDVAPDLIDGALMANRVEQYALLDQIRRFVGLSGDRSRELTMLQKMQAVAEAMHDQQRWVEVMSRLATYYWQVGQLSQAEEIARRAMAVARQNNDKRGEQYCLEQIARVYWTRRDAESMEYATQALVIAQELGDRRREGRLIELVGNIYTDTLNDADRAAIYLEQALEICRETGNRLEEAWTLWSMGGLSLMIDDFTGALARYGEAKKISEDLGASLQVGWDLYRMGDAWYNLGRQEEAQDHYEQAQIIFNASQHLRGKIYTIISLGLVFMARGQMEEAVTYLEQSIRQAEVRQDLTLMFRSYQALSVYYRLLGGEENLTEAIRLSNRIIKLASEAGHFEPQLLGHYLRGAGFFEFGDPSEAFKSSSLAVQQLEQLTFLQSPQIAETEILYRHSQIAAALGQLDTARSYWQKAYAETMRKADLIPTDQMRRHFLEQIPLNREISSAGEAG